MDEEGGPWIDHDGKSCPWGQVVRAVFRPTSGEYTKGPLIAGSAGGQSWFWGNANLRGTWPYNKGGKKSMPVVRYQIKKPKGLSLLEEILAEVKDTATPKEVAPRVKQGA